MRVIDANTRLIDLTIQDLQEIIAQTIKATMPKGANSGATGKIVRGRKNIAIALGIGVDKLDKMIEEGYLNDAIKKNGRTLICDIDKAFQGFNDEWN